MKIYKVLVDELPKTCSNCDYLTGMMFGNNNFCDLAKKINTVDVFEKKPDWCPLQEYVDNSCHCKKCDPNSYEYFYDDEDDDDKPQTRRIT